MRSVFNEAKNSAEFQNYNDIQKYICKECKCTFISKNYNLCPHCESIESGDVEDTLYIFADCFSYNNGKPNQMAGYCTIVTNSRFDLEDRFNIEIVERKAFDGATNNYGELMGVVAGLDYLINYDFVDVYKTIKVISDSQYVILGASERMYKWRAKNWTNTSGAVKNQELWELMYDYVTRIKESGINIEFIHQKGHVGKAVTKEENPIIYMQEKCDTLAVELKNHLVKKKKNS